MTVFWKTERIDTNIFACRRKPHLCNIRRHQALKTRWSGLLLQVAFFQRCQTTRVLSLWPLRGINKTAWGAKLILTADLAYPVSCAGLGHLLTILHYLRATMHSILQIGISRDAKCVDKVGFSKSGHIYTYSPVSMFTKNMHLLCLTAADLES